MRHPSQGFSRTREKARTAHKLGPAVRQHLADGRVRFNLGTKRRPGPVVQLARRAPEKHLLGEQTFQTGPALLMGARAARRTGTGATHATCAVCSIEAGDASQIDLALEPHAEQARMLRPELQTARARRAAVHLRLYHADLARGRTRTFPGHVVLVRPPSCTSVGLTSSA